MRLYTFTCGGLGDILFNYFHPGYDAGYFADIKKRHPDCIIRLIVCSVNTHSNNFFVRNPFINELVFHPFVNDHYAIERQFSEGCQHIHSLGLGDYTYQRPDIHLDPEERSLADQITHAGPFVCVHPFAGTPEREWQGRLDPRAVVDWACDMGHTVVVIGGNSRRMDPWEWRDITESFGHQRPQLYNLVNRHSVRLHALLAARATKYIGSQSAYCVPAALHDVPCLLFTDGRYASEYHEHRADIFGILARQKALVYYWQAMPDAHRVVTEFLGGA